VRHCVHCGKGKKRQKTIYVSIAFLLQELKPSSYWLSFESNSQVRVGLRGCNIQTFKVNNSDLSEAIIIIIIIIIIIMTCFLLQTAGKISASFDISFLFPLPKTQLALSQGLHSNN
jgi:hypothetical protein